MHFIVAIAVVSTVTDPVAPVPTGRCWRVASPPGKSRLSSPAGRCRRAPSGPRARVAGRRRFSHKGRRRTSRASYTRGTRRRRRRRRKVPLVHRLLGVQGGQRPFHTGRHFGLCVEFCSIFEFFFCCIERGCFIAFCSLPTDGRFEPSRLASSNRYRYRRTLVPEYTPHDRYRSVSHCRTTNPSTKQVGLPTHRQS